MLMSLAADLSLGVLPLCLLLRLKKGSLRQSLLAFVADRTKRHETIRLIQNTWDWSFFSKTDVYDKFLATQLPCKVTRAMT